MHSDFQNKIYCAEDDEYRVYCDICDKFAIDRYYNNHLKSEIHFNIIRQRQQLNNTSS